MKNSSQRKLIEITKILFFCMFYACNMKFESSDVVTTEQGRLEGVMAAKGRGYLPLIIPVVLLVGYRMISDYLVTRSDRTALRDKDTGVLIGAEHYDTGPADSHGAVILVHGFIGAGNNFNDLPEYFAELGWRVRVMRLPGHGTSPRDLDNVNTDTMLRKIISEMDDLRRSHEKVVLIGHSMGGTLCTLAASQRKVDRLVICSPYFGITHKWYYILKPETWIHITSPLVRWVYKGDAFIQVNREEVKDKIVSYRWVSMRSLKTLNELGRRTNTADVLSDVTCPALMIHSFNDEAASKESAEKAFNLLGSSDKRAVWLKASNHHIFWDYDHDQVISEIGRFLGTPSDEF